MPSGALQRRVRYWSRSGPRAVGGGRGRGGEDGTRCGMSGLGARLERGDVVVIDGGVSTAMEEKGLRMDREVWSGTAHMTHPDLVREVHEDYVRAGAEVITANTFG